MEQLSIFEARVRNGFNLHHEGGGLYRILIADSTARTERVGFEEYKFSDISLLHTAYPESESDTDDTESVSINLSDIKHSDSDNELEELDAVADQNLISDEDSNDAEINSDWDSEKVNENGMALEDLTYVPTESSRYNKRDDEVDEKNHTRVPGQGLGPFVEYSAVHEPYQTLSPLATNPQWEMQCPAWDEMNDFLLLRRSSPHYF